MVMNTIEQWLGISEANQIRLLFSIVVITVIWLVRKLIQRFIHKSEESLLKKYRLNKIATYLSYFLILLLLARIWISESGSFATYFGILSAGIAIALKDPIVNIAGWFYLTFWRPIDVGQRVEINDAKGDIIHIGFFYFTINEIGNRIESEQSTGRIIQIPNAKIFTEQQAVYTKGFEYIWNEIPVLITFDSNWKKCKQLLTNIANDCCKDATKEAKKKLENATNDYVIYYSKLTPIVYTDVKDSGVLLTIRYLCSPYQRRGSQQQIWEQILDVFDANTDLELAYPTTSQYNINTSLK